jgi:hypothetical protein
MKQLVPHLVSASSLTVMASLIVMPGAIAQVNSFADHTEPVLIAQAVEDWIPVGRINPDEPMQIELVNQTTVPLEYAITTNEIPPRQLEPGESTTLTVLPIPLYMLFSPIGTQPGEISLALAVSTNGNFITVEMSNQFNTFTPGEITLIVNETGAIFVQ